MRSDSSGLATFTCFYVLFKQVNFEGVVFLSKGNAKRRERLAEVQFVIVSSRTVSQSNYLNNSNKDCDWHILACSIRD